MEINKHIYYIKPNSENLQSKVERYEQRPVEASALLCLGAERTEQKPIPLLNQESLQCNDCTGVAMLRSLIIQIDSLGILNRELALEQQRGIELPYSKSISY